MAQHLLSLVSRATLVLLLMTAGCATVETTPPSADSGTLSWSRTRQYMHPLVREDGYKFTAPLVVRGLQGATVPVALYAGGTLLSADEVVPPWDNTEWKAFELFVPYQRLVRVGWPGDVTLYVVSPSDADTYVGLSRYAGVNVALPRAIWVLHSVKEDVHLPDGGEGFELTVTIHSTGLPRENYRAVALVRDAAGHEIAEVSGGPIRVFRERGLRNTYVGERASWNNLTIHPPYRALERIPVGTQLLLTPGLVDDATNELIEGTFHLDFWAGGSLARQQQLFEATRRELDDEIRSIEERLRILLQEGGR